MHDTHVYGMCVCVCMRYSPHMHWQLLITKKELTRQSALYSSRCGAVTMETQQY